MEQLTTPFAGALKREPSCEADFQQRPHSQHVQRVVGFTKSRGTSPTSVFDRETSTSSHASSQGSGGLSRQSSLGQQLRQQAAHQLQLMTPTLSIRTSSSSSSRKRLQARRPTHSAQPVEPAAQTPAAAMASSELSPCDATLPSCSGMTVLARQQSSNLEIPARLSKARTCTLELNDEMIAAAQGACAMQGLAAPAPSSSPAPCGACGPSCTSPAGIQRAASVPWGTLPSAQAAAAAHSRADGGSGIAPIQRAASTQEQLFLARADAAMSHAQVQCLHEALCKEREEGASLRAQLLHMTAERDGLLRGAAATAAAVTAAGLQGGFAGERDGADFTSPFGGFSPFTPGRDSM